MEHASIASFARFSLQLLAVGAPASFLADTHRAALDEVEHARLSFRLVSAYAGYPLGPGPIQMSGDALGPLDLAGVAAATVIEGCIGETLAALEADAALQSAKPSGLREVLTRLRDDESKHAELAWSFVRWALRTGSADGRLDPARKAAIRADGLRSVIRPAYEALFTT